MKPRQIIKGTTYLLTRRTTQGLFLLRPSKEVNACIRYCVAIAQRRSEVELHWVVFLSNHYHIGVTDTEGRIPEFTEELNKLLARSLNCHRGRWENFWSGGDQTSQVTLASDFEVMAKLVYSLANPTKALLVSHGNKWPGVRLFHANKYRAKKPAFFFRNEEDGGKLPDSLDLTLTPPPIGVREDLCDDVVQRAVSAREKQLRDRAKAARKKFMGAAAVKAQNIYGSPKRPAEKRGISPRLACRDKWRRIEILAQLDTFVADYRAKLKEFVGGAKDVLFPAGTYLMTRQFGARCEEP